MNEETLLHKAYMVGWNDAKRGWPQRPQTLYNGAACRGERDAYNDGYVAFQSRKIR